MAHILVRNHARHHKLSKPFAKNGSDFTAVRWFEEFREELDDTIALRQAQRQSIGIVKYATYTDSRVAEKIALIGHHHIEDYLENP